MIDHMVTVQIPVDIFDMATADECDMSDYGNIVIAVAEGRIDLDALIAEAVAKERERCQIPNFSAVARTMLRGAADNLDTSLAAYSKRGEAREGLDQIVAFLRKLGAPAAGERKS